jgi:hypothetical protein
VNHGETDKRGERKDRAETRRKRKLNSKKEEEKTDKKQEGRGK